jgi:porin
MKRFLSYLLTAGFFISLTSVRGNITGLKDPYNVLTQDIFGIEGTVVCSKIADHGVNLTVQSVSDMLGNVSGGIAKGGDYSGLMNMGLAADFEKAVGWKGASFKTTWLWLYGNNVSSQFAGNKMTSSGIYGTPTLRCYELWMQQNLLDDFFSLRAGQLALDTEFGIIGSESLFLNTTFGVSTGVTFNLPNGGPTYPMATPGVRLALQPTSWLVLRGALTQGNCFPQTENLNGFNWNFGPAGGLLSMNEAEFFWGKDPSSKMLPGYVKGGFWIESATTTGSSSLGLGSIGYPTGLYNNGFYFGSDQQLYKAPPSVTPSVDRGKSVAAKKADVDSGKGLSSFFQLDFSPQAWSPCSFYADSGLIYTGLIPGRDKDKAGVAFAYAQMGPLCRSTGIQNGLPGCGYELLTEFSYSIRLTPAVAIEPDIQYIIHPGGTQQYANALVVGFRAVIDF